MTTPKKPTRGALLRRIQVLEKELEFCLSMREIDAKHWREMARRCAEAESRVECALYILQTGDLPEGAEK